MNIGHGNVRTCIVHSVAEGLTQFIKHKRRIPTGPRGVPGVTNLLLASMLSLPPERRRQPHDYRKVLYRNRLCKMV